MIAATPMTAGAVTALLTGETTNRSFANSRIGGFERHFGIRTLKESPNQGGDVRRQAMLLGAMVLALTASGSTAYAAMGPLYHGSDYAMVSDIDGYNSYLAVCDQEADNHLVTANYREYPHPPGDNGSISDSNGSKSPCSGRNSPTYYVDFNVCEATQGCSRWW